MGDEYKDDVFSKVVINMLPLAVARISPSEKTSKSYISKKKSALFLMACRAQGG